MACHTRSALRLVIGFLGGLLGIAAVIGSAGCIHNQRMIEINGFETGYFQQLRESAFAAAYASLHSDVKAVVTPERFENFFVALTDTLGPMTGWEKIPGTDDQRLPLLEPERRRDPLPSNNPKATIRSRYLLKFSKGTATLVITTGWEAGRMVIRGQLICCMDEKIRTPLIDRAKVLGVADLYGVKPDPPPQPPATAPATPEPPAPPAAAGPPTPRPETAPDPTN